MGTKRTHDKMEQDTTGQPTLTRFRTRLQDARRLPMDLYDFDDSATDPEPARKRRKKNLNNLVVMSLLLILGLGIATTTCYLYGIGPWKASHVRAFYTSTKFMECWTSEEQTVSLTWIPQTSDNTTNQTQRAQEVNDWWGRSCGHSPDIG